MKKAAETLVVSIALVVGACGDPDEPVGMMDESAMSPAGFAADYATSTAFFTMMSEAKEGASPHGRVRVWYSTDLRPLIGSTSFVAPEGATSIKEFDEDSDDTLDGYAVMVKRDAQYDPENGNWYYEMRDPSGNVLPSPPPGKIAECISCHSAAKGTDYLAGTML